MKISTEKQLKNKWYDKDVWVYVWLVLFFPVGLYGLYKNETIGKGIKYTIYVVFSILIVGNMCTKKQPNNAVVQQSNEPQQTPPKRFVERGMVVFDANGNKVTPDLTYWIVEQELDDTPIKSQVVWHVAVEGQYDKAILQDLLTHLYEKANSLSGFKYYNPATHYQIVVYASEDRAKSKSGNWVALLNKIRENPFDYKFNELMITEAQKPATEKFGLSENMRMQVYKEIILAERRAMSETEKKYDLSKMEGTPAEKMKIFGKYKSNLEEKYKNALAKNYKINRDQLSEIGIEGFSKGWAFPPTE